MSWLLRRSARAHSHSVSGGNQTTRLDDQKSAEMLAYFAHEVQQPLSAARAASELLRRSADDKQRERALVVLDRQLGQLARLFDDLLEASRLHMAGTSLHLDVIDLRALAQEVVESIRPQTLDKHLRLATSWPDCPVWLQGDSARLQQVLSNLLVNAVKYTGDGGRVSIALSHVRGQATLTVSDTGLGIRGELLQQIFDPFTRGVTGSEEGLGVGLAVARKLVELHGGTIGAFSEGPGSGSAFVVTLPARVVETSTTSS